jgi:hypothetical protein
MCFAKLAVAAAGVLTAAASAFAMTITPSFDDAAMGAAGLSAAQITGVHNAFAAAALQFTNNFSDPIHIGIDVTAVAGTDTLGESSTSLNSFSYAVMQLALAGDRTTADDNTAVLSGGSAFTTTDPIGTTHNWWVSTAQAKAIGLIADNAFTDGTFTFGGGFSYDFDPSDGITSGQFDFQGIAMHEISEIMGRIPGLGDSIGGAPGYLLYDLFRYTGAGARGLTNGSGIQFSIDNGNTLLKAYNFPNGGGSDPQDWASGPADSFNASVNAGVVEPLTTVDLRAMDVIGYDRVNIVPEPSAGILLVSALLAGGLISLWRRLIAPSSASTFPGSISPFVRQNEPTVSFISWLFPG